MAINQKCPHCGNYVEGKLERSAVSKAARNVIKKGGMKTVLSAAGTIVPGFGNAAGFVTGAVIDAVYGDRINDVVDNVVDGYITDTIYSFYCPKCGNRWSTNASPSNLLPASSSPETQNASQSKRYTQYVSNTQLSHLETNAQLACVLYNYHKEFASGLFKADCKLLCNAPLAQYIQLHYNSQIPQNVICKRSETTYQKLADIITKWESNQPKVSKKKDCLENVNNKPMFIPKHPNLDIDPILKDIIYAEWDRDRIYHQTLDGTFTPNKHIIKAIHRKISKDIPLSLICGCSTYRELVSTIEVWKSNNTEKNVDIQSTTHKQGESTLLYRNEQEYYDEYADMIKSGEISERDTRFLAKIRVANGISEQRALELELLAKQQIHLSPKEQEYIDEYKEMVRSGSISDRDRRFLQKIKEVNGISDSRAEELEKMTCQLIQA